MRVGPQLSSTERCLLWDFDNTLAHRPGLWSQCLADSVNSAMPEARVTREQFAPHLHSGFPWHTPEREHHHLSNPDAWWASMHPVFERAIAAGAGLSASAASEIATQVRGVYLTPTEWVVFPDTKPALIALSGHGWRHVILSNHVPELPQLTQALGLAEYFDFIITSGTLGYEKPHPLAFKAAIDRIPPSHRTIMIGDSFLMDYKGARASGLDSILVRGSHPECDTSFPDLHAVVDYLRSK
ncbi:MAG TPA: HAD-IA family hydrolase [Steroidobacteraceae bacterium]|nr:HAD-IA family hydrolase [Steroidobacteraceae bacterium]